MLAMWQMFHGVIPEEWIDEFVGVVEKEIPVQEATTNYGDEAEVNTTQRRSQIRWINLKYPHILKHIEPVLEIYMKSANRNAFNFDINYIDHFQFTTYRAEDKGFYDWHPDIFWETKNETTHRKLSITLQLSNSDEYEGGDFEFKAPVVQPDSNELRKKGSILIFPSFVEHRVTPVTKGVRKSLVGWYEGPKFR